MGHFELKWNDSNTWQIVDAITIGRAVHNTSLAINILSTLKAYPKFPISIGDAKFIYIEDEPDADKTTN